MSIEKFYLLTASLCLWFIYTYTGVTAFLEFWNAALVALVGST